MKKWFSILIVISVLVLTFTGCSNGGSNADGKEKTINITVGGIQSTEDAATKAMMKMAEVVNEKSEGTINMQVSPAGQLGDATSQMEAVSIGTQEMFVDASSWVATFVDDMQVASMWFLFRDEEHYKAFLDSDLCAELEGKLIENKGVRVLENNWIRSPRSISSSKTVTSINDLKGLKIRVPDIRAYLESANALGLGATQIAWGETYLALQQGVVNACESPMDSMYTMKFYEPTESISVTEHIRDNISVYINENIYNGMSDNQKKILEEAAEEAGVWYTNEVKRVEQEYVEVMKSEGTKFTELDEASRAEMSELVAAKAKELEEKGDWEKGLFEKIQAIGK